MSQFGVTAVRWNADHSEVSECRVHRIERIGGDFALGEPTTMPFHDVANRVVAGDTVRVMVLDPNGNYERGQKLRVKAGKHEYLESYSTDVPGENHSLFNLPSF
jgi:hypothetical protein